MTRKDYVALAAALAKTEAPRPPFAEALSDEQWQGYDSARKQWLADRNSVADALATDNARFDRARFLAACGVAQESAR